MKIPRAVVWLVLRLAGLFGALFLVPLAAALAFGDGGPREIAAYLVPMALAFLAFAASRRMLRAGRPTINDVTQGFQAVVFGWLAVSVLAALPFGISGVVPSWDGAFFEAMSGLTTTGATVFDSFDGVPHSILLWRALTHFVGGLGIIALFVAVLPALGAGGVVLFRSEVQPSMIEERLRPRVQDLAKLLWLVYGGLCALQFALLWLCGMTPFEALCHAFSTVSTGGFSTEFASLAAFSPAAQWVTIVFMFLGGTSFVLHGKAIRGELTAYPRNEEFLAYAAIVGVSSALLAALLYASAPEMDGAVRHALFQAVSILTTTGFASADFGAWPAAAQVVIVLLMLIGGSSGSTSGGIKVFRFLLFGKALLRQLALLLHPSRVIHVRLGGTAVPIDTVLAALVLAAAFFLLIGAGALLLALLGMPGLDAFTASLTCVMCVGPGLGGVGPAGSFAPVPAAGKVVLSFLMLMGRLELYAVLALLWGAIKRR